MKQPSCSPTDDQNATQELPLQRLSEALQEDRVPKVGSGVYFHRPCLERSIEGRDVDMLTITDASMRVSTNDEPPSEDDILGHGPQHFPGRPLVFVSARVHPGETPAQFVFFGLLRFLLSDDPRAAELRKRFVFKLVPMLNPDGVARGHYRTNSRGLNLNRYYDHPRREEHEASGRLNACSYIGHSKGDCYFMLTSM